MSHEIIAETITGHIIEFRFFCANEKYLEKIKWPSPLLKSPTSSLKYSRDFHKSPRPRITIESSIALWKTRWPLARRFAPEMYISGLFPSSHFRSRIHLPLREVGTLGKNHLEIIGKFKARNLKSFAWARRSIPSKERALDRYQNYRC